MFRGLARVFALAGPCFAAPGGALFLPRRRPTKGVYSAELDLRVMKNPFQTPFMRSLATHLRAFAATIPGRLAALRHPTWRGVGLGLAAIPLTLLLYVVILIPFTPSISDLLKAKTAKPSVLMSVDGQELARFQRANRDWVKLDAISPNVVAALIATEDHRFYDHHGMDFRRTVSSVFHTLTGRKQGGSTLTQQLARNLYPEEIGRSATLTRKLKEAITAFKIEAVYSKDEILESYLNTVPFLYNAYGIEMAARTYFDKSASELDVLQSATLVGMLKGASLLQPGVQPGARAAAPQHRADADGQAPEAAGRQARGAQEEAAEDRLRAAGAGARRDAAPGAAAARAG